MARTLVIDVKRGEVYEKECEKLKDYYTAIGCEAFDIACRNIGGMNYDLFVDDEGLFTQHPKASAVTERYETMLVGNIVIANHDCDGNTTSLTDEDIKRIKSQIQWVLAGRAGGTETYLRPIVICDYPIFERR